MPKKSSTTMASKQLDEEQLHAQLFALDQRLDLLKKQRAELLKKIQISRLQLRKKERTMETRKKLVAGSVLVACAPSTSTIDLLHRHLRRHMSEEDTRTLFGGNLDLLNLPPLDQKTSTRRLIVLGALFMDLIEDDGDGERTSQLGKLPWSMIRHHFERHITRRDQRALFGLPPLSKDALQLGDAPPSLDISRPLTWLLSLPLKRDP